MEAPGSSEQSDGSSSGTLDLNDLETSKSMTEVIMKVSESEKQSDVPRDGYISRSFSERIQRIRNYVERESNRLIADQKRIDVNPSIRREIDAFHGTPCCRIRRRMFHLGLI